MNSQQRDIEANPNSNWGERERQAPEKPGPARPSEPELEDLSGLQNHACEAPLATVGEKFSWPETAILRRIKDFENDDDKKRAEQMIASSPSLTTTFEERERKT